MIFDIDRVAARDMTPDQRETELARVEAKIANGFGEHGGSPGEWWYERADELRYWMARAALTQQKKDG